MKKEDVRESLINPDISMRDDKTGELTFIG